MFYTPWRAASLAILLLVSIVMLATCGGPEGDVLYVQDVVKESQAYVGQEITVHGAYVWRADSAISVLALGVSTLDSGSDARPLGDPIIWLEGFPADVTADLHRPGDSVYGFVRVTGLLEEGSFGPEGAYPYRMQVTGAEPIERVQYVEHTLDDVPSGESTVTFSELQQNPDQYDGQQVTTRGYYFWNGIIWVLADGISAEEDGGSPQPLGDPIWMEGFPPDVSTGLNVGPNNTYVWGLVEVTGTFETGGGFGREGAYDHLLTVQSAETLASD